MQIYNKYTRWKNYLTTNSVLRVIFFVKILFLKVSFRKTHIDVHAVFAVENKLCITKTRDQHPFIGRGSSRYARRLNLRCPCATGAPPDTASCRENGSAPSTARFAKLPITADFSKSPYVVLISSPHPYPQKCHKDT